MAEDEATRLQERLNAHDASVLDEIAADDYAAVLRVLDALTAAPFDSAARGVCARCILSCALVCDAPLLRRLAAADVLRKWVFPDMQSDSPDVSARALDFLFVLCAAPHPPLPALAVDALGRNLARFLVDAAVDTKDREPPPDGKLPGECRAALAALVAVYSQVAASEQGSAVGGDEEEKPVLNRVLDAIVRHPKTEDGTLGQLFVVLANRYVEEEPLGQLACGMLADLAARPAVLHAVIYDSDLHVLTQVLARHLEDLPLVCPDRARERVVMVLSAVFRDRLTRVTHAEQCAYAAKTLAWLQQTSPDPACQASATALLAVINA